MKKINYNKIFVQQHGQFACGIACLAMITKYYGGNARQEDIRNISGTTLQGTSLLGLYQAAEKLNLSPDAYKADIQSLKDLDSPAILHVIKNQKIEHYIVCFAFEKNHFIVGDPDSGIKEMSEEELLEIWQSKALLLLKPTDNFVKQTDEKREKRLWLKNIIKADYSILSVAFVLGVIVSLLGLSTAIFSQKLIDVLLPSENIEKIILGLVLFFILLLARSALDFLRNIFLMRQTRDLNNRLVDSFFSKLMYLPKSFFDSTKTGEIITRMNDSRRIQQTLTYIVGSVFIEVLILLFAVIYLILFSWKMALIAVACIPLFVILVLLYNNKIIVGQRNVMAAYAATEGAMIDTVQGMNDIKTANKQDVFKQSIKVVYGVFQEFGYRLSVLGNQYGLISNIISTITSISLILLGIVWVLNGQLKLGELLAIITVGNMIISSTANLSSVNIRLQEAKVAFERYFEFVKAKPEFELNSEFSTTATKTDNKHLQIKNLSYRFIGRKKIFNNISMEVNKGEIISILGKIGSGKSTLIQLIQRYYTFESGEILFNRKPLSEYSIPLWRSHLGVVSQYTKIFSGTVGENICMENFTEKRTTVFQFCEKYGFDKYFYPLPQSLDTLVGEDGINLSGGQQQLIALARALYHSPTLLLLDEPTSSMDIATEAFVIRLIENIRSEMAVIIVTHREQLAMHANRVYRLHDGTINLINLQ